LRGGELLRDCPPLGGRGYRPASRGEDIMDVGKRIGAGRETCAWASTEARLGRAR
jgi:hypothetical protein